jgi:hypothetical protein
MSVAIDAQTTSAFSGSGTNAFTSTALTVGSGSNRALIVVMTMDTQTPTGLTLTWDSGGSNQAMTQIGSATNGQTGGNFNYITMFGLVNPISGNKTLAGSWTSPCGADAYAYSFTGANQTGGTTSFPNFNSATGASSTAAVSITSATGNQTVAIYSDPDQVFNSTNGTAGFIDNSASGNYATASDYTAGAATVSHSAALGGSSVGWVAIGCSIAAAGAASPVIFASSCIM